ncbi:hypothetical protein KBY97_02490 [Synechococcus sp. ATX 2A4]|uniref:hypothetical protein n=1 Tax=Synechococcus sp. ATX 2A4 TaxID=2823727 RepID=UPI0020CED283|nr:hypothetical protein [Synechococcus sp. ATX 2A4]MCP9883998.1 hypothetical protein [Synechococcus sp. ATX 2A4]
MPQAAKADFIYGIADDNNIYQVDTNAETSTSVFNAVPFLGDPGASTRANAFAYDAGRKQFWFLDSGNNLRFWNGTATSTLPTIVAGSIVQSSGAQPASAAFFNNSFWYFSESVNTLNRITLTYDVNNNPEFGAKTSFTVNSPETPIPNSDYAFGDIAINSAGILFGATVNGRFFRVDLTDLSEPTLTATSLLAPGTNPSLQISFSSDFMKLYGQSFNTGQWYELNTGTGVATLTTGFLQLPGLRDLGGAGAVPIPGPLPLAGAAAAFAWSRRLRRRVSQTNRR